MNPQPKAAHPGAPPLGYGGTEAAQTHRYRLVRTAGVTPEERHAGHRSQGSRHPQDPGRVPRADGAGRIARSPGSRRRTEERGSTPEALDDMGLTDRWGGLGGGSPSLDGRSCVLRGWRTRWTWSWRCAFAYQTDVSPKNGRGRSFSTYRSCRRLLVNSAGCNTPYTQLRLRDDAGWASSTAVSA